MNYPHLPETTDSLKPEEQHSKHQNLESDRSISEALSNSGDSPTSQSSKPKRIGFIVLGILALIGVGYGGWRWLGDRQNEESAGQQQGPRATPVQIATATTTTVENTSEFTGTLEAEETVSIQPEVEGQVNAILVEEGERVSTGTPLVVLSGEREAADLAGAQAQVGVAQAGQASAAAEVDALRAELQRAQAELNLQNEQIRRTQYLVNQGAIAREELDRRQRDVEVAQAQVNAVNRRIQAAQAGLSEAQANLRQQQANLARIRQDVQDTTVRAPFAGTIGTIPVNQGDYVEVGQSLTTITANQNLELNLRLPQERLADLQLGLPVRLTNGQGDLLGEGEIGFISPRVNTESQLVATTVDVPNPERTLRDGQFVRAEVIWEQRPNQVVIPQTAVIYQGDQRFVYVPEQRSENAPAPGTNRVLEPNQPENQWIARRQPIELGLEQGTQVEVLEGVEVGDRIITSGTQRLADGAPIRPLDDQMQAENEM